MCIVCSRENESGSFGFLRSSLFSDLLEETIRFVDRVCSAWMLTGGVLFLHRPDCICAHSLKGLYPSHGVFLF